MIKERKASGLYSFGIGRRQLLPMPKLISALPCIHISAILCLSIPVWAYTVRLECVLYSVLVCVCVSPGNREIPGIPLAGVPQVVRPHGASQSVSWAHPL